MRSNDWGSWGQWPGPGQSRGGAPWGSGPPPWIAGLFGLAQQGGTRAPKVRRGDVRAAILDVLAVEPMNGYQIIQQIAERSGGAWKPSPGSVYPTVQQLEDEGLVEATEAEGRRTLRLSDAGREYVATHPEELAATWRVFDESPEQETHEPQARHRPGDGRGVADHRVGQPAAAGRGRRDPRRDPAQALRPLADGDPE